MGIDQSVHTGIVINNNGEYKFYLFEALKEKNIKNPSIHFTRRILLLKSKLQEMIDLYKPDLAIIEGMAYGSKGSMAFDIGGISHIFRECLIENNIKFIVAPPTLIKKFATGKGTASKEEMIEAADKIVTIPIKERVKKVDRSNNNVVDAFWICKFGEQENEYWDNTEKSWET